MGSYCPAYCITLIHRCKGNIISILNEVYEDVDWIYQLNTWNSCKYADEPSNYIRGGEFLVKLSN